MLPQLLPFSSPWEVTAAVLLSLYAASPSCTSWKIRYDVRQLIVKIPYDLRGIRRVDDGIPVHICGKQSVCLILCAALREYIRTFCVEVSQDLC